MTTKYVSCMKINGVPLLPPVITPGRRKRLKNYKLQAIKVEKRLETVRELKARVEKLSLSQLNFSATNKVLPKNTSTTIEHEVCFTSSVPLSKSPNLSCDIQVSQYTNNEFSVVDVHSFDALPTVDKSSLNADTICLDLPNSFREDITVTPRLIRSNSYTLDSPSPQLLQYMHENGVATIADSPENSPNNATIQNKSMNQENELVNLDSSSEISNYQLTSETETELKDLSEKGSIFDSSFEIDKHFNEILPKTNINNLSVNSELNLDCQSESGMTSISRNSHINNLYPEITKGQDSYFTALKNNTDINRDDTELKDLLAKIPEDYSKQLIILLEKQRAHQSQQIESMQKRKDLTLELSASILQSKDNELNVINMNKSNVIIEDLESCIPENIAIISDDIFIESNNENSGIYANTFLRVENFSTPNENDISPNKTEFYSANNTEKTLYYSTISSKGNSPATTPILQSPRIYDKTISCAKLTNEQAASIIGAAARGYLVRRLMKTVRVQTLIATIRDVVICAVQLHKDNIDNVNEADVELHRRLINQVSANCFEFHDVFFALTTAEQMNVIAVDRQKLREKLNRPTSSNSSSRRSTSRSTPGSTTRRSLFSKSIKT